MVVQRKRKTVTRPYHSRSLPLKKKCRSIKLWYFCRVSIVPELILVISINHLSASSLIDMVTSHNHATYSYLFTLQWPGFRNEFDNLLLKGVLQFCHKSDILRRSLLLLKKSDCIKQFKKVYFLRCVFVCGLHIPKKRFFFLPFRGQKKKKNENKQYIYIFSFSGQFC